MIQHQPDAVFTEVLAIAAPEPVTGRLTAPESRLVDLLAAAARAVDFHLNTSVGPEQHGEPRVHGEARAVGQTATE